MGSDSADDILSDIGCKKKYMGLASSYFNTAKKVEWFDNELVREIVRTIDKAELVGFSAISNVTQSGYSVDDLAGGSKTLITNLMDRRYIYSSKMGNNCNNFMERIANEVECIYGEDLIIVQDYLNLYSFRYVKEIEYLNWGIKCHCTQDIHDNIRDRWREYNRKWLELSREDDEEEEEDGDGDRSEE